jgi:hypothetical protein
MTEPVRPGSLFSWFSRLSSKVQSLLAGLLLLLGAFPTIAWIENRAVDAARFEEQRTSLAVSVPPDAVDSSHEGQLVHVVGELSTTETLTDPILKVGLVALKMERQVEMFQWVEHTHLETRATPGGGTKSERVATYSRQWSAKPIDSRRFVEKGYDNPTERFLVDWRAEVASAKLGAFIVPRFLLEQFQALTPVELTAADFDRLSPDLKSRLKRHDGRFVSSADPTQPQVGDLRIRLVAASPSPVTVLARQTGSSFEPYLPNAAGLAPIGRLQVNEVPANELLAGLQPDASKWTWWLRGVGLMLVWLGVVCVSGPVTTACTVTPYVNDIVLATGRLFPTYVAFLVWGITFSGHWFGLRPMFVILGYLLLIAVTYFLWVRGQSLRARSRSKAPRSTSARANAM